MTETETPRWAGPAADGTYTPIEVRSPETPEDANILDVIFDYPPIYKEDTKGKTRVWYMQRQSNAYRTVAGILDGKLVTSGWTFAESNPLQKRENPVDQAIFEVLAEYRHQLSREYHRDITAIGGRNFFAPMLAQKFEREKPLAFPVFMQPKLDGVRCIVRKEGMFSREGKPILGAPHVHEVFAGIFALHPELVFDGELYRHELKDDFNAIISAVKKQKPTAEDLAKSRELIQYHVYDFPVLRDGAWTGNDAPPFSARHTRGAAVFRSLSHEQSDAVVFPGVGAATSNKAIVHLVETVQAITIEEVETYYGAWVERGYEGAMVRLDGPYEQKRSKQLLKFKEFIDQEYPVVAIEEGKGNWGGLAKRVICRLPDGRTFGAGIRGNQKRAKELLTETHKEVTVRYFNLTPDGVPRFPVVTKFHGEGREH